MRMFLVSSLLTLIGLSEFQFRQAKAEVIWKSIDTPKAQPSSAIWDSSVLDSVKRGEPLTNWEFIPEAEDQNQPSSKVIWELLQNEDDAFILHHKDHRNRLLLPQLGRG